MPNFSEVLTDLDGVAFSDMLADKDKTAVVLTLGRAAAAALTAAAANAQPVGGADHLTRMLLAIKVKDGGEIALSTAEIEAIKERVAAYYASSIVVGKCWLLLDPALAKVS